MPEASEATPSSAPEHNMPSESMPRMPRFKMSRPSGILVPSVASGTKSPACMLNAPHHTWRSTPSPASTHTRCTLAASACRSVRNTLATTTPSTGVPTISVASTDSPSDVMATANSSSLQRRRSANSSSHERTMRIRTVSRSASHWHTYRAGRPPHAAL